MRLLKGLVMGLAVLVGMGMLSCAYAKDSNHEKDKIKLLDDSSAALAKSNPELSAKLAKLSKEEADEKVEKGKAETTTKEERKARRAEHLKLFKDSAAALEKSNPDLAKRLTNMAEHMQKKLNKAKAK